VKIAVVTDDGRSVSPHFGRARAYLVVTVEDGAVVGRELRPKPAPHLEAGASHGGGHGAPDGAHDGAHDGPAARARHDGMIAPITDCAGVIARGMGRGAFDRISCAGIRPVVTDIVDPDDAALAFADGRIENLVGRLH